MFSQFNISWKIGLCARERVGLTASTTCSKGTSWYFCACSAVLRTCANNCCTLGDWLRSTFNACVFTKRPISGSTSARWRLAIGLPITT